MSKPTKRASTFKAGGGQSSAFAEHQAVKALTPEITRHLNRAFEDLASSKSSSVDGPLATSYDECKSWFMSPASSALAPPVDHDLTLPLCNYFISSSHNTYLSGNQLYGSSTTATYKDVLERGCRCLEIDVWNGEDDASSVSSSDVEDAEHDRLGTTKKKKSAMSRFRNIRGKAKEKLRRSSNGGSPDKRSAGADQDSVDEVAGSLSAAEIAERRVVLKTEPRVYHGYTLTKDVPFREVCQAINDSAFKASTLPVIVSLEVHCNLDQQKVMVDIMQETWAGHLVDINDMSFDDISELPSPEALRNKILIKVKWSPTNASNDPTQLVQTNTDDSTPSQTIQHTDGAASSSQQKKVTKILDALSKLGVYTRAYSFKSFSQPEASIPTHVFSLDENKLGDIHSHPDHGPDMFSHNRNFLVRIYPSGVRVNSSNIDPTFSWRQGAQIVALNWQSLDKGMMLNEGMFAGEDGYVLKPEGFRSSAVSNQVQPVRHMMNLTIKLIAGQNLPMPLDKDPSHADHLKPYVKFQLHVDTHGPPGQGKTDHDKGTAGLVSKYTSNDSQDKQRSAGEEKPEEERKLKRKSRTATTAHPNFGDDPENTMVWSNVPDVVEQLSFLRVKVKDDRMMSRDDLAAWACIRLDRLKTGYRFLHLLDAAGAVSEGVLLVWIGKQYN